MRERSATILCVVVAASLLVACGDDRPAATATAADRSTITYRLTPEPDPNNFRNGSFIGIKDPPRGTSGLVTVVGLSGTFEVISEAPTQADVLLDYRITRVDMTALHLTVQISAEGDELGRVQLHDDGMLSMELKVPILGITYDLSTSNSFFVPPNAIPPGYRFDDGQLRLRGVPLHTLVDEPYWGRPSLFIWADPES